MAAEQDEIALLQIAAQMTVASMPVAPSGIGADWDPTKPGTVPASVKSWCLLAWECLRSYYAALVQVVADPTDWPRPSEDAAPVTSQVTTVGQTVLQAIPGLASAANPGVALLTALATVVPEVAQIVQQMSNKTQTPATVPAPSASPPASTSTSTSTVPTTPASKTAPGLSVGVQVQGGSK